MATDPESKVTPQAILDAITAELDPCLIAAIAHVEGSTFSDALEHEGEVLFGQSEAAAPPVVLPEV